MQVPAGKYTLWTVPHTSGVDLIVNKETGQWGTEYDELTQPGRSKDHYGSHCCAGGRVHNFHRPSRHTARNACDGMGFFQVDGTDRSAVRTRLNIEPHNAEQ